MLSPLAFLVIVVGRASAGSCARAYQSAFSPSDQTASARADCRPYSDSLGSLLFASLRIPASRLAVNCEATYQYQNRNQTNGKKP
jgi:hypothetical protein